MDPKIFMTINGSSQKVNTENEQLDKSNKGSNESDAENNEKSNNASNDEKINKEIKSNEKLSNANFNADEEKIINVQIAPGKKNKTLTIVFGIPEERQTSVLQYLKKKMSCGGTIMEKKYLQLQGNYKDSICGELKGVFPGYRIVIGSKK